MTADHEAGGRSHSPLPTSFNEAAVDDRGSQSKWRSNVGQIIKLQ